MTTAKNCLLALSAVGGLLAGACEKAPFTPPKPAATSWAEPLTIGPITYFNTQCVACHGPYGKLIADHNIAINSNADEYRAMVQYMVTDRSGSALAPRELDAQTAYCASLAAGGEGVKSEGSPTFVCVKTPVMEGGLEGEVTPGSTVTLVMAKGQVRIAATVDGHTWAISPQQVRSARQTAGDDWVNAVIEANAGAGTPVAKLVLSEAAFVGPRLKH